MRLGIIGTVAACLLAAGMAGCNCGASPGLTAVFTDLTYTQDGRALVLEATNGLFAALPPTSTPVRLSDRHCEFSKSKSLDCVRIASDGRRAVALINNSASDPAGSATLHLLTLPKAEGGQGVADEVIAQNVYDAAFSQDGAELVWAVSSGQAGYVTLVRLGPAGPEELVPSMSLSGASANAMKTVVVTPTGSRTSA
jgi:hypothetical protein